MDNKELAMVVAELLSQRKAKDIKLIDISEKSGFADYFINATAGSIRQLGALADDVKDKFAENGIALRNNEGRPESGWILVDGGDIIVNLFTSDTRDKYALERLWADCETTTIE